MTLLGNTLMLMLAGLLLLFILICTKSTTTSDIKDSFKYDVFLSFTGEDTRKNFVDHLYEALKDKGIYTYKDDEKIKKGKSITDDLIKAIQDSRFYIIVFSQNYSSSSWCLEELVKIMECQKMTAHTAYPIFFDVEPTEIRKQSGAVGKAFAKHKHEDAAGKWREALKEAADLAGWELKNTLDGHEAKFIKKIVQEISLELRSISFDFDEKLVGMETRVNDVVSSLDVGTNEVRMIGIKGMGGIGKTTTARAVFDYLSNDDFEAKSFVDDVRRVSKASMFGLKKLQQQVLSDVLKEDVTLNSVNDGKNMMKKRMRGIKVLLVLDDVDHIDQLEALANEHWFKPGSRILITTRDEQVLNYPGVKLTRDINLLSDKEAISLFSRKAFGRENPLQGYEELSGKVVSYAAGLPLTVKVLGSFLCGKDKDEWVDAIERLKEIPLKNTMKTLELSYISLEEYDYKEIFLDIACILKGRKKEDAIKILESCGFHARNGLKVLEQRSLISISKDEVLGMHDHIEEMGKNIVRRLHRDEPNQHSRLWINEEIEDIFANDKVIEAAARCLKLTTSRKNSRIVMKGLGKMKKLRYLEVHFAGYDVFLSFRGEDTRCNFVGHLYHALMDKGIYTNQDVEMIQKGKMTCDPLLKAIEDSTFYIIIFTKKYASSTWCLDELLQIMECHKTTEHTAYPVFYNWKPTEVRKQSQKVGVAFTSHQKKEAAERWKGALKEAADLTGWELNTNAGHEVNIIRKIVEELSLELRFIDSDVDEKLMGFVGFDMKYNRMAQLREEGEKKVLDKLKFLSLDHSNLLTFDFGMTPNLETLSLKYSCNLVELCIPVTCQKLKHLDISYSKLRTFDLRLTPNLETLSLQYSKGLVEINAPVVSLKKFVELNLRGCALLEKLPEGLGQFGCLKKLDITRTGISHLPQSIFGLKGLLIAASHELLQLYDFPSEIETTTSPLSWD